MAATRARHAASQPSAAESTYTTPSRATKPGAAAAMQPVSKSSVCCAGAATAPCWGGRDVSD